MKICIIGHTERNYLPYITRYTDFFAEHNIQCDVICWQREAADNLTAPNEYNYSRPIGEGAYGKLMSYHQYRKYIINFVQKNKYDKLIVLTSVLGVALCRFLITKFKGRYIFDVRDYSFEKFFFYRHIMDKLIKNSALTTISSKGFLEFLTPHQNIVMNHNMSNFPPSLAPADLNTKQVINIGFIGGVRYYEENIALIEKLKNTFKYQLWYIGQPTAECNIEGYCAKNQITNVSFIGKFSNDQKVELYKNIDIINSIYGDDSLEVTTALPNRLYEACIFKKPIISSRRTFLGEVIDQYRLGVVVDVEKDDVLSMLNDYVASFNEGEFLQGCNRFIEDVKHDDEILYAKLDAFIKPQK